ncbi:sodium:solute symporter [Stenotrophomonas tumulicola]|uniref:Sodium:solute symporter n=1 Tax=Stenotrophomonas tumulicola TaxID=1685415 RepID=A0A7W3IFY0_9GAMM|nr:sodium:solute symporter [Stenotrophomonas tumulicola]MBA8680212.1 sodium:solute symporter [Stenotrophomonas tumulicola]
MLKPASFVFASTVLRHVGRQFRLVAALVLLAASGTAAADSLTTVKSGSLPMLPVQLVPAGLVNVEGRTVAFSKQDAWALAADGTAWEPLAYASNDGGMVLQGSVHAAGQAYLLGSREAATVLQPVGVEAATLVAGEPLPLPVVLDAAHAAALGDALYVAGNDAAGVTHLYRRSASAADVAWQRLAAWPQVGVPHALQAQKGALYAGVGIPGQGDQLWRWTPDDNWRQVTSPEGQIIAGSMRALGQAHLLMLVKDAQGQVHARTFHTITSAWATLDDTLASDPVAVTAWGNGLAWASPGAAGTRFQYAEMQGGKHLLRWLDWTVIGIYLLAMLGMGFYFYLRDRNSNTTADFFVGGRSIPFWAAGISLYATNTSSISFIAIPAKAFDTNWQYMTNNLIAVTGLMFVAIWIVPLLRRLDLMSVFSYLETRFHPAIRMLSSALCIVMQIGSRMSVILFLPALAISTITGVDVVWSIMLMGVFTIIYSTAGGSKAVIWTDVVQVVVMFGGALFAIGFIFLHAGGDLPQLLSAAAAEDKTRLFDFSFDLTKATVWGFIFLVVFDVVLTFPKDQVLMQRTLSTRSDKEAGRSIWTFAAIMIPGGFVFYGIGTALWMYYRNNPERLNPLLPIDATFPLFIAAELPAGVTGLIIAGIFAAAMSTLSSIINSISTLVSVDFYQKLVKDPNDKTAVRIAEWSGVGVGFIGIGIALLMSRYDIHSLFDVSIELAGLLGGGFAGAYTLGMFTRRANAPGVAIGVAGSILVTLACWTMDLVHPYFYLAISILLCIVIGYVASLFFPAPAQSLKGLTIYRDTPAEAASA